MLAYSLIMMLTLILSYNDNVGDAKVEVTASSAREYFQFAVSESK